jgi:hypothetical protein
LGELHKQTAPAVRDAKIWFEWNVMHADDPEVPAERKALARQRVATEYARGWRLRQGRTPGSQNALSRIVAEYLTKHPDADVHTLFTHLDRLADTDDPVIDEVVSAPDECRGGTAGHHVHWIDPRTGRLKITTLATLRNTVTRLRPARRS